MISDPDSIADRKRDGRLKSYLVQSSSSGAGTCQDMVKNLVVLRLSENFLSVRYLEHTCFCTQLSRAELSTDFLEVCSEEKHGGRAKRGSSSFCF